MNANMASSKLQLNFYFIPLKNLYGYERNERTKNETSKAEADADFTLPAKDYNAEIITDDSPARKPTELVSSLQQII